MSSWNHCVEGNPSESDPWLDSTSRGRFIGRSKSAAMCFRLNSHVANRGTWTLWHEFWRSSCRWLLRLITSLLVRKRLISIDTLLCRFSLAFRESVFFRDINICFSFFINIECSVQRGVRGLGRGHCGEEFWSHIEICWISSAFLNESSASKPVKQCKQLSEQCPRRHESELRKNMWKTSARFP